MADSEFIKNKEKSDIFVGFKNDGKESFADTTEEFVRLMNRLSLETTENKGKVIAPLIKKDKEDILVFGERIEVDFRGTFSCYVNNKKHCGKCLACMLRKEGFYWSNIEDNTEYEK